MQLYQSKRFVGVISQNEKEIVTNCNGITFINQHPTGNAYLSIDGVRITIESGASFGWTNPNPNVTDTTKFDLTFDTLPANLVVIREIVTAIPNC